MKNSVFCVVIALVLTACGGGGGGTTANLAPTPSSSAASSPISSPSSSEQSSASSASSAAPVVNALPEGSGVISTRFTRTETYSINGQTGVISPLPDLPHHYRAADIDPDGYVIAARINHPGIDRIDLLTGVATHLFDAPENLQALAVSPQGTIVGVSQNKEFDKHFIYRFTPDGDILSKMPIDGFNPSGIDFDASGQLYGLGFGWWKIDPETGATEVVTLLSLGGNGDIDIDKDNVLRAINFGILTAHDFTTHSLPQTISETVLQHDYFAFSPLVYR